MLHKPQHKLGADLLGVETGVMVVMVLSQIHYNLNTLLITTLDWSAGAGYHDLLRLYNFL